MATLVESLTVSHGLITAGQSATVGAGLSLAAHTLTCTVTQYTDEQAQDAIASILTDTGNIAWTYNDGLGQLSANIVACLATQVYSPFSGNCLVGKSSAGSGFCEEISVGTGLSLSGGTLSCTVTGGGSVTTVSVVSANGFAGTVANATTTPAITLTTTVTGILKGDGTAISAASAGTDYLTPTGNGSGLTALNAGQITTGLVAVARGGTGVGTLTNHGILLGQGTSAVVATAVMTDGQLLVGQSAADPLPKTITGDVTFTAAGATAIGAGKVTNAMIAAVDGAKVTTGTVAAARLPSLDALTAPAADVSLNSHKITNLTDPTLAQDAATKAYVDAAASGLDWKASVRASSAFNVATLAGGAPNVVDGVTLAAGDRLLLRNQSTSSQNGIYSVQTLGTGGNGTWVRASDADTSAEVTSGMAVWVTEGTIYTRTAWVLTTADPIVLGTTGLSFTQFGGVGTYTGSGAIDVTGTTISVAANGVTDAMLRQGAALTVIGRSANSTGNVADIAASADGDVLRRSGTTLGFGDVRPPQSSKTANFNLDTKAAVYAADVSGGSITANLPAASGNTGLTHSLFLSAAPGANTLTVDANASETINGATTLLLYHQHDWVTLYCDGTNWRVMDDNRARPQAQAKLSADQSVANNTVVTINWGSEDYDAQDMHDNATNNSRITVKRPGKYLASAFLQFEGATTAGADTGVRQALLYKTGVADIDIIISAATATGEDHLLIFKSFDLAAGDYIEVKVFQNSGNARNVRSQLSRLTLTFQGD